MSTLVADLGTPVDSSRLSEANYSIALNENRVISIYTSDDEDGSRCGEVGHKTANVRSRVVFPSSIPDNVEYVMGIKPEHFGE